MGSIRSTILGPRPAAALPLVGDMAGYVIEELKAYGEPQNTLEELPMEPIIAQPPPVCACVLYGLAYCCFQGPTVAGCGLQYILKCCFL